MVVGAPTEDSGATGVNGDQNDETAQFAGAAYVFVRNGTTWTQQAYLKASNTNGNDRFGSAVAISGDMIVIGAPMEASSATGINPSGSDNSAAGAGAAYIFVRSGTTWTQQAYIKASNTAAGDSFGWSVAISGETVVVGAFAEESNATGINGNQSDNSLTAAGAAYVFMRSGGLWSQEAYLKASNTGANDEFGWSVAISNDSIIIGARMEFSSATGVNGDQSDNSANQAGAAYVFVRSAGVWTQQAYLKASNTTHYDWFGQAVAISGDTDVVGADFEQGSGTGVDPPSDDLLDGAGAAYVFLRAGSVWTQQAYLKASNTASMDGFGYSVATSGDSIIVGARAEDSSATGIDGLQSNDSANAAGAAYVFLRTGTDWNQQAYVKASNTEADDQFGTAVALFGDTAAVGAPYEASSATGINGDQGNGSWAVGAVYVFNGVGAPDIAVEQPQDHPLANGERVDFGLVGVKLASTRTFTLRNHGSLPLTDIDVTVAGTHAAQFTITAEPDPAIAAADSTTFTVQAKVTSTGVKTATLHIASNDPDEPDYVILLAATGFAVPLPTAVTGGSTSLDFDPGGMGTDIARATLQGTVDANGYARDVVFDFGLTKTYGNIINAVPPTLSTNSPDPVSADLTGLKPHTLYHYRVRAAAEYGSANGADKVFTTANHAPTANSDGPYLVLPSANVVLDVLDNDTDTDGDALRILSKPAVLPSSAGKIEIVANQLVFTASPEFAGASFSYTMTDGFSPAVSAIVSLSLGSCSLVPPTPPTKSVPSAGVTYSLMVNASGAWSVRESLLWASVVPTKGNGNTMVNVTLLPNASRSTRTGSIKIGGAIHTVAQTGVVRPILDTMALPPGSLFNAIVSGDFSLVFPTSNPPVTYAITDLPPGLTINHATGTLSGKPTKAGSFDLTVKASNAAGASLETLTFTIDVAALPLGTVGTFHGSIDPSLTVFLSANQLLGSRLEMTSNSSGLVTGNMVEAATRKAFTGRLNASLVDRNHPTLTVVLPGTPFTVDVMLDNDTSTLAGTLHDAGSAHSTDVKAWRNPWLTNPPINKATKFKALHTFAIENLDSEGPEGFGYGAFTVTESTGNLTLTGKLADGTALLSSTFIGKGGQVLLYQSLYANRGSCLGKLIVTAGSSAPQATTRCLVRGNGSSPLHFPRPATPSIAAALAPSR